MKIKKEEIKKRLENKFYNSKKSHIELNILNYSKDKIKNYEFLKFDEIELKNNKFIIYREKNKKSIYMIEIDNYKILLRDIIEKRFMIEKYLEKEFINSKYEKFIEFYEKSNFIIIEENEYQLLDYLSIDIKEK